MTDSYPYQSNPDRFIPHGLIHTLEGHDSVKILRFLSIRYLIWYLSRPASEEHLENPSILFWGEVPRRVPKRMPPKGDLYPKDIPASYTSRLDHTPHHTHQGYESVCGV